GSMLFERRVPFRPDWEAVITPVVDFLRARPDVNAAKIGLIGVSFGGVLTPRAVAFEHRLAALCTDPGVVDAIRSWHFPPQLLALVEKGQRQEVNAILARFTVAQGAQFHDEPMAPQHRNAVLFDWMSETLGVKS